MAVQQGGQGSRGSAARTLKVKQALDRAWRIKVELVRRKVEQSERKQGHTCKGNGDLKHGRAAVEIACSGRICGARESLQIDSITHQR